MATVLTKGEIVLFALRKFAIASNASLTDVEPQSIEDGVNDLEDMMSEWMINPGDIGLLRCSKQITPEFSTLKLNLQLELRSMLTAFFSLQPLTASITGVSR